MCVLADFKNQCQTASGEFAQCADGKFYQIKSPANGDYYKYMLSFPDIELEEIGNFEISFYVLIACSPSVCVSRDDSMTLTLTDGEEQTLIVNYTIDSFEYEKRWLPQKVEFSPKKNLIKVRSAKKYLNDNFNSVKYI